MYAKGVVNFKPSYVSMHTGFFWFRKWGVPGGSVVKNPLANVGGARDMGSIPGSGRSPGVGDGNPLQYSCPEKSTDREAWPATVHRVTKSGTPMRKLSTHSPEI